jgi:D-amino-acid dehydrogenase
MSQPSPRKVSVIGAGIIGICSALWLQREGFEVTIIDPNPPGSGSSYGNAGGFSPASVVPMSMPGVLQQVPGYLTDPESPLVIRWGYLPTIAPWLWRFVNAGRRERVEEQAKALRNLLGPVFDCLSILAKQAEAEHLIRREGMLYVYRSNESLKGDTLGWDLRRRNGIAFEQLSGKQITEFDPSLSGNFKEAIFVPGNGHTIDPQDLVQHLAQAAIRAGAKVIKAYARGFELTKGRLAGVKLDGKVIPADAAVIACGAHSKTLTDGLGDNIPLDTERGYHVLLKTPEATPRIPVLDAERKFVATPMRAGLRVAGIVEFAGLKRPPDMGITRRLLGDTKAMFPALREDYPESEVSKWMGFRPSMPDSLPVIGRAQNCRDIVYAFGHGHAGMCGGPMTGKLVAELVADRPPSFDLAPFSPIRF